eukprot:4686761-Prymnesium_polylepis.1
MRFDQQLGACLCPELFDAPHRHDALSQATLIAIARVVEHQSRRRMLQPNLVPGDRRHPSPNVRSVLKQPSSALSEPVPSFATRFVAVWVPEWPRGAPGA